MDTKSKARIKKIKDRESVKTRLGLVVAPNQQSSAVKALMDIVEEDYNDFKDLLIGLLGQSEPEEAPEE